MNARIPRFLTCGALLLSALAIIIPPARAADAPPASVQKGDSLNNVKHKLGEPRSDLEAGNRQILIYPQGQIVLEDGRVSDISSGFENSPVPDPGPGPSNPTTASANTEPDLAEHPADVTLVERNDGGGVITLLAQSDTNTDFTITLQADLTNMTPSHPLPYTTDSGGRQSFALLQLKRDDPTKPWKYTTHFDFRKGGHEGAKITDTVYLLPYQATETHRVGQGNFGAFSHFYGSQNEYAVDFSYPPGTIVCAARAGVVTGVRQDFTQGGTDEKFKSQGNYIIIRHDDGTYAEYYHIQHNGALVKLGQHVGAGQHIALSGATGYASAPHIHFAVFETIDGKNRITLPVKFKTDKGVLDTLKQGESY